jgi:hypothetical protein
MVLPGWLVAKWSLWRRNLDHSGNAACACDRVQWAFCIILAVQNTKLYEPCALVILNLALLHFAINLSNYQVWSAVSLTIVVWLALSIISLGFVIVWVVWLRRLLLPVWLPLSTRLTPLLWGLFSWSDWKITSPMSILGLGCSFSIHLIASKFKLFYLSGSPLISWLIYLLDSLRTVRSLYRANGNIRHSHPTSLGPDKTNCWDIIH